jgi:hypothetical protein
MSELSSLYKKIITLDNQNYISEQPIPGELRNQPTQVPGDFDLDMSKETKPTGPPPPEKPDPYSRYKKIKRAGRVGALAAFLAWLANRDKESEPEKIGGGGQPNKPAPQRAEVPIWVDTSQEPTTSPPAATSSSVTTDNKPAPQEPTTSPPAATSSSVTTDNKPAPQSTSGSSDGVPIITTTSGTETPQQVGSPANVPRPDPERERRQEREAQAQREREAQAQAQREREAQAQAQAQAQREREAAVARQREREAQAQREREAQAQREREAAVARQRERDREGAGRDGVSNRPSGATTPAPRPGRGPDLDNLGRPRERGGYHDEWMRSSTNPKESKNSAYVNRLLKEYKYFIEKQGKK